MPDQAYADVRCRDDAIRQLIGDPHDEHVLALVDTVPAARDIAAGQTSNGLTVISAGGHELELNLTAQARLDAVQNEMLGWARDVCETRGVELPDVAGQDPIVMLARFLADHVEWYRHQPMAAEFLSAMHGCAGVVRGLARGPSEQRYLGPCGAAELIDVTTFGQPPGSQFIEGKACDGDVYARRGAGQGTCRTCGATVATAERLAWLDAEVRSHAFRASEIANAYGIPVKTIRTWAERGLLTEHGRDRDDRPLYVVGDVLDLHIASRERRAEQEARREQKAVTCGRGAA